MTMLSANRPPEMWSTVAPALAMKVGCTTGTCTVAATVMRLVCAAMPAAQVMLS